MEGIRVACGQITWGWGPTAPPAGQVLAEIAQAGYEGAPAGLRPGVTASQIREQLDRAGLKPAPGYLGLGMPGQPDPTREQLRDQAARMAASSRELGLTELYVAATFPLERLALAGQITRENATSTEELKKLAELLSELGRVTQTEGVSLCFHNHVGSTVETRDEVDRLFEHVDRSALFQGADIGHLAWAGDDVVQFTKDYADSIKTLHIKDISARVRAEGIAQKWDYMTFNRSGIFAELGEGMVDFPAMFAVLKKAGFKGWIVVETDVTTKVTPLESATISRNYLRSIGV